MSKQEGRALDTRSRAQEAAIQAGINSQQEQEERASNTGPIQPAPITPQQPIRPPMLMMRPPMRMPFMGPDRRLDQTRAGHTNARQEQSTQFTQVARNGHTRSLNQMAYPFLGSTFASRMANQQGQQGQEGAEANAYGNIFGVRAAQIQGQNGLNEARNLWGRGFAANPMENMLAHYSRWLGQSPSFNTFGHQQA